MPARHPKQTRIQVRVSGDIDERITRLADATGMNKGTLCAFLVAASLREAEVMILGLEGKTGSVEEVGSELLAERRRDLDSVVDVHKDAA